MGTEIQFGKIKKALEIVTMVAQLFEYIVNITGLYTFIKWLNAKFYAIYILAKKIYFAHIREM